MSPSTDVVASRADRSTGTLVQFTLAVVAGGGAANVYYHQPVLGLFLKHFGPSAPTLIAAATLFGYGLGILLLVPLGDAWPRRTLIVGQQIVLAGALVAVAVAQNLPMLTLASVAVGACATTAQQAIPFAAELASPESRGRAVGRAMMGLLLGVLLARTLSGTVADVYGWRAVFAAAAAVALAMAGIAAALLPRTRPTATLRYGALLASVLALVRDERSLRWATLTQGFIFAGFNAFWASLALHLEGPAFGLGPSSAGLFGLVGAIGAGVAPLSGRLADRHGSRVVVIYGAAIVLIAFGLLGALGRHSLAGIGVGVVTLDAGASLAMIANQACIYAIRPESRGRLNTVFMTGMFAAGGVGASLGTLGYAVGGWIAVSLLGMAFAACACLAALWTPVRPASAP